MGNWVTFSLYLSLGTDKQSNDKKVDVIGKYLSGNKLRERFIA